MGLDDAGVEGEHDGLGSVAYSEFREDVGDVRLCRSFADDELGGYFGIFHDRQLVAMAGQRFRPPGCCEISAVCTHPDARRRRYASIVTARVAEGIAERGETPFLHVAATNVAARPVYEQLGFTLRAEATFRALKPRR